MSETKPSPQNEEDSPTPNHNLSLSPNGANIDVSLMSEEGQQEIAKQVAQAQIKVSTKIADARVENEQLNGNLTAIQNTVSDANNNGVSATISNTTNSSTGSTETVIGNTDNAAKGKSARSHAGSKDNTVLIVVLFLLAAVAVALILR